MKAAKFLFRPIRLDNIGTGMSLRAEVDKKFIRRFLIIGLGCIAFMLWGGYDALYTYPSQFEAAKKYKDLYHQMEAGEINEDQRAAQWKELVEANKWPQKPNSADVAQQYIYFNWFLFGAGLLAGIFFLMKYMKLLDSWMEAKDGELMTSWGTTMKLDQVKEVNKTKWSKKGIARVIYADENGSQRTLVLDDFKYHRETVGEILKLVEEGLSDEQIVGALREPAASDSVSSNSESSEPIESVAD